MDLDGPKAATKKQQKQGHVTFQTASSVRGLQGGGVKRFHAALGVLGMKISPSIVA